MRAVLPLLVVLLAPAALAQAPLPGTSVALLIDPFEGWAAPAGEAQATPVTLTVGCDAQRIAPPTTVRFSVVQAPAWAEVTIGPETVSTSEPQLCETGELTFVAELTARSTTDAPAFYPALIEIEAIVSQPMRGPISTLASIPFAAGYFSIIDVAAERTLLTIPPDGSGTFKLVVTNFGNANTRVDVELKALAEGLLVEDVEPFVLQSRHAGGTTIAKTLRLDVERVGDATAPIPLVARWRSSYALDRALAGDSGELKLMVVLGASDTLDAASVDEDLPARVPTSPALLVAALAVGAALLRRR